jgi:hypothetical protein
MHVEKSFKMIKSFSKLTTSVNPFVLRILKTSTAKTLLLAIVPFATLPLFGCANGGGRESVSFISASGRQQDSLAKPNARNQSDPYPSYFVDWTKSAKDQTGPLEPLYSGRGTP